MEHINFFICSMISVWIQWSQRFHGVLLSSIHVNKSSAQEQCKNYGGLLSYETFLTENVSDTLNENYKQIDDGASAWVSELVNYSQFVSWHGCYFNYALSRTDTFPMVGESVSSCFNPCNKSNRLLYIGISWNKRNGYTCYCISSDGLDGKRFLNTAGVKALYKRAYPGNLLNGRMVLFRCPILRYKNYTSSLRISVYTIYGIDQTPLITTYGQCVYANKVISGETNFRIEYGTRSCFSHGNGVQNGYICVGNYTASCIKSNSIQKNHCIIHSTSDWYKAQKHCISMNGKLVEVITEDVEQLMAVNVTYWTGLFREFKIIPSSVVLSEEDVCLSVRKVTTKFVLEPTKCSDVKLKICQNGTISSVLLNDNAVTFETDKNSKSSNVIDTFERNLTISLTFNGVFLLAVVCLALVLYRIRRKTSSTLYSLKCEKATTTTKSNDTLADDSVLYGVDNNEYHDDSHYYSCPEKTATETGRHANNYDHSHDSGAKQYDHICLRNASNQNVGQSDSINVSDYSHINAKHGGHGDNINVSDYSHINALAKVTASNQTVYEEIKVQTLDRKTETAV